MRACLCIVYCPSATLSSGPYGTVTRSLRIRLEGRDHFAEEPEGKERTMAATAIDSMVFRHIFSSEPMRQDFSDENRVQCYLDIEAALAQVQARLGLIPERAADEITAKCTLDIIDMDKLKSKKELLG